MPKSILHQGVQVQCAHGGLVQLTSINPQVTVSGQPIATLQAPSVVSGCPLTNPPGPCTTAQWVTASTRVTFMGAPVLLLDSQATCMPTGTPAIAGATQPRVSAM